MFKGLLRRWLPITAIAFIIFCVFVVMNASRESASPFRTTSVTTTDLLATVSATGTVEPEEVVDVGAQVAGQIIEFGTDSKGETVDYGSLVKAGTVLARIDDSLYSAEVDSASAQVKQAEANIAVAKANVMQMRAKVVQSERDWKRAQGLASSDALAQTTYDQYKASFDVAEANLSAAEAEVIHSEATLSLAQANLYKAQRNLSYCTITSPVEGVIVDRRVNIGQTVVSSLNAPSLFLIARDLSRIQVWVSVNEADISSIHKDQEVTFTVDAFPGEKFSAKVGKIRLNASMTQNIVTYTVEVNTENPDNRLLPYLTANVQFKIAERKAAFAVPNAALAWWPGESKIPPKYKNMVRPDETSQPSEGIVWIVEGFSSLSPIRVKTGLTDGTMTEVDRDGIAIGMQVVIGEFAQEKEADSKDANVSPFSPQLGKSRQAVRGH